MLTYLTIALALAVNPPAGFNPTPILDAIEKVETGGQRDPANAIGDGGKALGPMQIHRVYWLDAVEQDPSLVANGETYDSVRDRAYARRVVMAYWSRYEVVGLADAGAHPQRRAQGPHQARDPRILGEGQGEARLLT